MKHFSMITIYQLLLQHNIHTFKKKNLFTLFVNKISKCFQHVCDKIRLGNKNIKPSKKVLTSCKTEIIAIFVFPAPVGAHTCKDIIYLCLRR